MTTTRADIFDEAPQHTTTDTTGGASVVKHVYQYG